MELRQLKTAVSSCLLPSQPQWNRLSYSLCAILEDRQLLERDTEVRCGAVTTVECKLYMARVKAS